MAPAAASESMTAIWPGGGGDGAGGGGGKVYIGRTAVETFAGLSSGHDPKLSQNLRVGQSTQ